MSVTLCRVWISNWNFRELFLPSRSPSSCAVAEVTGESSSKPAHIPYITNMEDKTQQRKVEVELEEDLDDISWRSTRSHWSTWFAVRLGSGCSIGRAAAGPTPPRIRTLFQLASCQLSSSTKHPNFTPRKHTQPKTLVVEFTHTHTHTHSWPNWKKQIWKWTTRPTPHPKVVDRFGSNSNEIKKILNFSWNCGGELKVRVELISSFFPALTTHTRK